MTGKVKRYMGLRALIGAFYESLRKEAAPPVQPEHGLLNVRLMDQIRISCHKFVKQRVTAYAPAKLASAPRFLVTGASGFLGGRLVERLSSDQIPVLATTRLMSRARPLPEVKWVQCDLTQEEVLRNALAGVETIFHCAALAGPPGSLEEYEEANVKGTVRLARLAAEAGVKNLIYISSLSVYGNPSGHTSYLDETAPYDRRAADRGVYTQSKLAAEKALLAYVAEHNNPRVIVLRAGSIYGPGAQLPIGRFQLPSSSKRPVIAGSRRVPMRPLFFPYAFVWTLMLGVDLLAMMRHGKLGTARFRLKRTLANMRFRCSAARKDLGWEPRVSLADGLARVVRSA
jgi:nucleoside-diphosphate-sugar epimerase